MKKQSCFFLFTTLFAIGIGLALGAATDDFQADRVQLNSPPANSIDIDAEKNDNADLSHVTRRIFFGTGGDVVVTYAGDGTTRTLKNQPSGSFLWIRVKRVKSTGTTATQVIGEY